MKQNDIYDNSYHIRKGYSEEESTEIVEAIKLKARRNQLLSQARKKFPNESVEYITAICDIHEELESKSNTPEKSYIVKNIRLISKENGIDYLSAARLYNEAADKFPTCSRLMRSKEPAIFLFGENSQIVKSIVDHARMGVDFDRHATKYNSIAEAEIAYREKYTSFTVDSIMRRHNVSSEEAAVIIADRKLKAKNCVEDKPKEEIELINSLKGLTIENRIRK